MPSVDHGRGYFGMEAEPVMFFSSHGRLLRELDLVMGSIVQELFPGKPGGRIIPEILAQRRGKKAANISD